MFGALAGSGALPMMRSAFEAAIRRGQVGVSSSLAAFSAGFEVAGAEQSETPADIAGKTGIDSLGVGESFREAVQEYSGETRAVVAAAVERLIDYQDADYAEYCLRRLERFREIERRTGDGSGRLLTEVARQLALAMAYEDTIRVAELKIRPSRFARVRREAQIKDDQILEIAEFFHPRVQEVVDTLPAPAGRWLLRTGWVRRPLERLLRNGRIIRTTSIHGFLLLYALSKLKRLRRRSLRFADEQEAIGSWLDLVAETAAGDYALALEVARMRGLVKGYGDTIERGRAKFGKLTAVLPRLRTRDNSGAVLKGLIKTALTDEEGRALDKSLAELELHTEVNPSKLIRTTA
jgi:indolepyruvate ferredoxin oxidoreductase beta subunit